MFLSLGSNPIYPIDQECSEYGDHGHHIVIRSDEIELPSLPAEGEQEFYASVHMDEEEVKDEMRAKANDKWEERFSDIREEKGDHAGNKERA